MVATQPVIDKAQVLQHFLLNYPPRWFDSKNVNLICVLGTGKCGTVTLTHLLNCVPNVFAYHELAPRLWHLNDEVYKNDCKSKVWDEIYWATRRDVCSVTQCNALVFGDINHRSTIFLPAIKRLFPKVKFILLWRDFDECVVSMTRWGVYSRNDRALQGRLFPKDIKDSRIACAWYWIILHEYILKHIGGCKFLNFPFAWIKNREIDSIINGFSGIGLGKPQRSHIEQVLSENHNKTKQEIEIPKIWGSFDRQAKEITQRLKSLG